VIKKSSFLKFNIFLIFGLVIFFFGIAIILVTVQNTKKNIKTNLLYFSESVSAAINPERIKTLTASPSDDNNPDYLRLNQQLEKVQPYMNTQGIRWSYLVLKKNDQLFFSADSIPADQFGDSTNIASGDIYNDPPSELPKVFQDQQTIISQPYQDEWGYFISAFVPVKDFSTGEVLAVVGFDMDYEYLQTQIYHQIIFPLVSTFLVLVFYIIISFLISRQLNQTNALKESEERFYFILEFAIDPIIMMNDEGNITLWNKAAEKTFGYSEHEALGKSLFHLLLPPKRYDNILNPLTLQRFAQTGKTQFAGKISELETINKAGKIVTIEFSTTPLKIKNKNYVFGIIRDISQRKESEMKFSLAVDAAIDPVIMMDQKGLVTLWNRAAEKTFGYSQEEALGKSLHHLILPPKKYDVKHSLNLKNFSQSGQSSVFGQILELETISKSGKIIPIELSVTPLKINEEIFAFGVIRDITVRKENEEKIIKIDQKIKEEKAKTEALLSGIGDGVLAVDKKFNIIYTNQATEKLLGWTSSELIGKNVYNIVTAENDTGKSIPKEQRLFTIAIKTGKNVSIPAENTIYYIRKDKTKFPISVNVSPVKLDDKITGAINVFRDITHEKEVDKMKNEFISLASHQLRTPLSAIKWYAEMLLDGDAGKLSSEQTKFIDDISVSNQRMIELVNTLLNISRIESGRIIIESKLTDLKEIISSVVSEFAPKLKEKEQKIIVNINPNLPKINCDPKLIFEVYKNLISNAIKYSRQKGEIQIFVSTDKDNLVNQVTDEGYGIPKKDESKVFTKFYRGDNIIKIETEGTGLGLYLTKSIVESSGGKIWFKTEENKGTTFWFSLPLKGVKPQKGEVSINS